MIKSVLVADESLAIIIVVRGPSKRMLESIKNESHFRIKDFLLRDLKYHVSYSKLNIIVYFSDHKHTITRYSISDPKILLSMKIL